MSVLDHLRQHTRALHQELEQDLDIMRRLAVPTTRLALMRRLFAVYDAAESALAAALDPIADLQFAQRRKTPVLLRDLASLGVDDVRLLPRVTPPPIHGASHALGFAYVLEGASLGGQVIKKHLRAAGLPLTGTEFFGFYGDSTGRRWREFCAVLETECTDIDAAIVGARQGFGYVHAGLADRNERQAHTEALLDTNRRHSARGVLGENGERRGAS